MFFGGARRRNHISNKHSSPSDNKKELYNQLVDFIYRSYVILSFSVCVCVRHINHIISYIVLLDIKMLPHSSLQYNILSGAWRETQNPHIEMCVKIFLWELLKILFFPVRVLFILNTRSINSISELAIAAE